MPTAPFCHVGIFFFFFFYIFFFIFFFFQFIGHDIAKTGWSKLNLKLYGMVDISQSHDH